MKKISKNEMSNIINKRVPLGVFYREYKNNKTGQKIFIGIDNRTGEAWTDEFKRVEELKRWLGKTEKPIIICKKCKKNMCISGITEVVLRTECDNYYWDGSNMVIMDTVTVDSEMKNMECLECEAVLTNSEMEKFEELY